MGTLWHPKYFATSLLQTPSTTRFLAHIDVDRLRVYCEYVTDEEAARIREAADKLHDLCMSGCILADDVGSGKTKQVLLVGFLHIVINQDTDSNGNCI